MTMKQTIHLVTFVIIAVAIVASNVNAQGNAARQRALIIGVGQYKAGSGFSNLDYTTADARVFADKLGNLGVEADVLVTGVGDIDLLPLKDNLKKRIEAFAKSGVTGDKLILAYAGHGILHEKKAYICPADASIGNGKIENVISLEWITKVMAESDASSFTFFCDACQENVGGGLQVLGAGKANTSLGIGDASKDFVDEIEKITVGKVKERAIFQSCAPNQYAYADDDLKHGVFFHYVIQAISDASGADNGDGNLMYSELQEYLARNVAVYLAGKNHVQTPQFGYPSTSGRQPFLQWPKKAAWTPRNSVVVGSSDWIDIPFGGKFYSYKHEIQVTPSIKNSEGTTVTLCDSSGEPLLVDFVLVEDGQQPFYISRDKVTAKLFRAYEKAVEKQGLLDREAVAMRRASQTPLNCPIYSVTADEAIDFCKLVFDNAKLPSLHQWDLAYGVPSSGWSGRDLGADGFAIGGKPLPIDRANNPDVSPSGCRDMASNGKELTTTGINAQDGEYPHNGRFPRLLLRGWSYKRDQPCPLESWKSNDSQSREAVSRKLGAIAPDAFHPEISFRVVIEIPTPEPQI